MKKFTSTMAVALMVAFVFSTVFSFGAVTSCEALGWGSIKKAAKKVGGVVKKGAKKVSKKAYRGSRKGYDKSMTLVAKGMSPVQKYSSLAGNWYVNKKNKAEKWVKTKVKRVGRGFVRAAKVNGKHLVDKLPSTTGTITTGYKVNKVKYAPLRPSEFVILKRGDS